jgi:RimJ/RimL family protein N-acetyltransferase
VPPPDAAVAHPDRLAGDGVALRAWRAADAPAIERICADPVVRRWSSLPRGVPAWIERQRAKPDGYSFAVTAPGDDRALGRAALGHLDLARREAELSYWLLPAARGRGLALAAARLLAAWGFEALGLATILLDIDADNVPSQRLATVLGARRRPGSHVVADREGVARELVWYELHRPAAAGRAR